MIYVSIKELYLLKRMTKHQKYSLITLVLISCVFVFIPVYKSILIPIICLVFTYSLLRGVFSLQENYFMHSMSKSPIDKCILSFDDGPSEYTLEVLKVLKKHEIGALFFVIGKQLESFPELKTILLKEGHLLGNHSYSHATNFAFKSTKSIVLDLEKTERLLGADSHKLFRTPIGISNPNIARAVRKLGLKSIAWDLRSFDTRSTNSKTLVNSMLKKLQGNSLVLLHDNLKNSAENLDLFIVKSKAKGVKFTNSDELKALFYE